MNAPIQTDGFGSQDPGKEADKVVGEVAKIKDYRRSSENMKGKEIQPPHQSLYRGVSIPVTLTLFHVGISSLLLGIVPRFVICFLNSVFGLNL